MKTSFWTKLLDVISPRSCAICGQRLSANETALCPQCQLHLPLTGYASQATDNPMVRLFWGQFPVERGAALFFYQSGAPQSQLVYDIKYHGRSELAQAMGLQTARLFQQSDFFEGIDAIVPVPLTRKRQWQRGFNQSQEIARGVASLTGLPIYNKVLKRISFTESQTHKSARERRHNVANAFALVDAPRVSGKHLLLIDDVVTTGATIIACAQALCQASGVSISILSLGFTKT